MAIILTGLVVGPLDLTETGYYYIAAELRFLPALNSLLALRELIGSFCATTFQSLVPDF